MADLRQQKAALRRRAIEHRKTLHVGAPNAGGAVLARFDETAPLVKAARSAGVFAGYWPIHSEIDPRPLMRHLLELGLPGALPVTQGRNQPLVFRRWSLGSELEPGGFGVSVPPAGAGTVIPGMLLVPLLAYDDNGHRLGYGAGYYDRTLEALRRTREMLAVGVAYAGQRVETVPATESDQRLDWVVTEDSATRLA